MAASDSVPPAFGPGRRVVYRPNNESFGEFMVSEQMRDVTAEAAGDVVAIVREIAPRSDGPGPHMADEYHVDREAGERRIGRNIRVRVDVFNTNPAAAANEFGTRRNRRSRPLGRAAALVGEFHDHGEGA